MERMESLSVESACYQELENILYKTCPQDMGESVLVKSDETVIINQLIAGLELIGAGEDCRREVIPLMCQHFLGLCSDLGALILPTSSECERIETILCAREWETATQLGFSLPNCNSLPSQSSCLLSPSEIVNTTRGRFNCDVEDSIT